MPLPPGVDLSAYRIVQEALTNTLKHGRGTPVREPGRSCDTARDALELEIVDDGARDAGDRGERARAGRHAGAGRLYGGAFSAGPRPGGGYAVRARLPVGGDRR